MDDLTPIIIAAVLPPVAATIVGIFAARLGVAANLKQTEYRLKRVELLEKLLNLKSQVNRDLASLPDWDVIDKELSETLEFVQTSKVKHEESFGYNFDKRHFLLRMVTLPKPRTFFGWVGAVIFYLYGIYGLIFALALGAGEVDFMDDEEFLYFTPIVSFIFAYLGRYMAINSSKIIYLEEQLNKLLNKEK